mmetsp:Transcript_134194/g.233162  ORF Transcript_134194/g.233162 Transcript_134194/m.233162 type:complete len:123 (+) Transcript_134194:98-466(+)
MGWGGGGKSWGGGGMWGVLQALMGKGKGKGKSKGPNLNKYKPEQKVWVGNLPADKATWKELNELFKTVGVVKWVQPMGKKSRCESCVAMSTAEEAAAAIASLQGSEIGGQAIQLDAWEKKEK